MGVFQILRLDGGDVNFWGSAETIALLEQAEEEDDAFIGESVESGEKRVWEGRLGADRAVAEEAEGEVGVGELVLVALVVGHVLEEVALFLKGEGSKGDQYDDVRFS